MRFVHFTTDIKGGAGIAAFRLHQTMLDYGLNSVLYNKYTSIEGLKCYKVNEAITKKRGNKLFVFFNNKLNGIIVRIYNNRNFFYHSGIKTNYRLDCLINSDDIVLMHWVSDFLDYKSFFENVDENLKIFFFVHDFNIISGRLHTLYDKMKNSNKLISFIESLISKKKIFYLSKLKNYKIIANSNFTFKTLKSSNCFENEKLCKIYLGLPITESVLISTMDAKKVLGFNENDFLILMSANDIDVELKGYDRFLKLFKMFQNYPDIKFVTLGKIKNLEILKNTNFSNFITWDFIEKSRIFSAANVVISTSYEETFGQTVIEAYANSTPVIVYNGYSALPEIVQHNKTGFIATNTDDVFNFILKLKGNLDLQKRMGDLAKDTYLNKFTSDIQLQEFLKLLNNS
ncbi:glycosyltransferase [Mariniflexile jejuense]|uniref:Glycosyltransferase n=1 Tax=Mariniflexile jejuense TaxID=1173582 RepID=A0ABW3JGE6_9FLAO